MAAFTNQATLSYNNSVTNSNVVTGEIVQVLSVQKDSVVSEYIANDVMTFVVSIVNSGTTPFTNLTVTDDLGAYSFQGSVLVPLTNNDETVSYYVNGQLQASPDIVSGPPFTISGINVPSGGTAMLIYRAALNVYAPLGVGESITNTVTITGGGVSSTLTASETVVAANTAYLTISKSVYPLTVVENGQLTYTFVIENTGNTAATAADNVVVTDTFNPVLNSIQVTLNGVAQTAPAFYTYDSASGVFATVAGQITVPAATYTQDTTSGIWTVDPGVAVITVTGTV